MIHYDAGSEANNQIFAESIQPLNSLTYLNWSCNSLGIEGAWVLAEGIRRSPCLQHMDLKRNSLSSGGSGTFPLAAAIGTLTSLSHLNMSGNSGLGWDGLKQLSGAIAGLTGLRVLNIQEIGLGHHPDGGGARFMAEAIRGLTSLQRLNMKENGLGDNSGDLELFDAIQVCTQLQTLTLRENSLGPAAATLIAVAVVGGLTRLRKLHVSRNRFGAAGVSRLADAIKTIPYFRDIVDEGYQALDLKYAT